MTYSFFKMNEQKLHKESHIVSGMEAVPYCEKHQRRNVTDVLVVQELESLVYVLEHPKICLDVEGRYVIP